MYFDYNKPSSATSDITNNSVTSKEVEYDLKINDLPIPELKGWTFCGWKIDSTSISANTVWNYTSNKTAKAQWRPNTFIISYLNGLTN